MCVQDKVNFIEKQNSLISLPFLVLLSPCAKEDYVFGSVRDSNSHQPPPPPPTKMDHNVVNTHTHTTALLKEAPSRMRRERGKKCRKPNKWNTSAFYFLFPIGYPLPWIDGKDFPRAEAFRLTLSHSCKEKNA